MNAFRVSCISFPSRPATESINMHAKPYKCRMHCSVDAYSWKERLIFSAHRGTVDFLAPM